MKYSKNKKYRDQEVIIEKEIVTLKKSIKKNLKKKSSVLNKAKNFFKNLWK